MAEQEYKVRDPSGAIRVIRGPAGATDEQIVAQAQRLFGSAKAAEAPAKPAAPAPDEAEEIAGNPLTRFALGAASPFIGLSQLASKALSPISEYAGINPFQVRRLEEMKKRGMSPTGDPKDAGFDVAGTAGAVLGPAALGAMKIPLAATKLGRSAQGAAVGTGFGATAPVTEGDSYAGSKGTQIVTGALLGGLVPPAIDLSKATAAGVRNVVDPWLPGGIDRAVGRTANEAAGGKRDAVIAALQRNQEIVPGSRPTAGQAAAEAGSAEFSGLQRAVEYRRPSESVARAMEQEAARRGAVGQIAGTPDDLASAVKARGAEAAKNYGAAEKVTVQADDALNAIMARPSMEKAVAQAKELAAEKGAAFDPAKVESLHFVKMAMDDLIGNPERFGIGAAEARAIGGTQRQFIEWLGQKAPAYDTARTAYAAASKPINRMEVGQELEKSLTNSVGSAERPAAFATAVRDSARTIKRATGNPRFDKLDEVLAPDQVKSVQNVVADLKRDATHEQLAQAGAPRAREILGQMAPKAPAAGMFNPKYSVARAIVNRLEGRVTEKGVARLAEAMENPVEMARLMQNATPQQKAIIESLLAQKVGRGAIVYGTQGAAGQEQF